MRVFHIANHSNNLDAYIKISKKRGGRETNLDGWKYAAKTIEKNPIISDKVKLNDLEQIENDHLLIISVYSKDKLIRQSTRTLGNTLNLFVNDDSVDCLINCGLIYSFNNNQRDKTSVKQTIFQMLGHKLGKDFRELKCQYLKKHKTISMTNDKLIYGMFGIGYNIDFIVPMTNSKNIRPVYRRKYRTMAVDAVSIVCDSEVNEISADTLIVVSNEVFRKNCPNNNCNYNSNANMKRHLETCKTDPTIKFVHHKIGRQVPIETLLRANHLFSPVEVTRNEKFIFVNFLSHINPDTQEEYISCFSACSNIGPTLKTLTCKNLDWFGDFCEFVSEELVRYRDLIKTDCNVRRKRIIRDISSETPKSAFVENMDQTTFGKIRNYFRHKLTLKIICSSLKPFISRQTELQSIFSDSEFICKFKKNELLFFSNKSLSFYNSSGLLNEEKDIGSLSDSWLEQHVQGYPKSFLVNPEELNKQMYFDVLDPNENECHAKNQLFFHTDQLFSDFTANRCAVICDTMHRIFMLIAQFFYEHFEVDLFDYKTLSGLSYAAMLQNYSNSSPIHTLPDSERSYCEDIQKFCWGGIGFLLKKHLTTLNDPRFPTAARCNFDKSKINEIISYDINGQYLATLLNDLPVGLPVCIEKTGDTFKPRIAVKSENFSVESLRWFEYIEKNSGVRITHAMNGGEIKVQGTKVDGYVNDGNRISIYMFYGCYWHFCRRCYPDLVGDLLLRQEYININDLFIREQLAESGQVISIFECEWMHLKREKKYKPTKLHLKNIITESDILSDQFFGFVMVDLVMDPSLRMPWLHLPYLYEKRNINGTFTVVPTEKTTMLIFSPLLDYYRKVGITVKVHYAIMYEKGAPFREFAKKCETLRQKAADIGDISLAECIKMIGNSGIGRLGLRVDKFANYSVISASKASSVTWARVKDFHIINENNIAVKKGKKTCSIRTPTHIYNAILQLSKLDLYKKIFGLAALSRPGAFSLSYIDTDCFVLGFNNVANKGLLSIIDTDKTNEWKSFELENFVTCPSKSKSLGLLKVENQVVNGSFCAVGLKQYLFSCTKYQKQAIVGLDRRNLIKLTVMLDSIYENKTVTTTQVKRTNENNIVSVRLNKINILSKLYIKGVTAANCVDVYNFDNPLNLE